MLQDAVNVVGICMKYLHKSTEMNKTYLYFYKCIIVKM